MRQCNDWADMLETLEQIASCGRVVPGMRADSYPDVDVVRYPNGTPSQIDELFASMRRLAIASGPPGSYAALAGAVERWTGLDCLDAGTGLRFDDFLEYQESLRLRRVVDAERCGPFVLVRANPFPDPLRG